MTLPNAAHSSAAVVVLSDLTKQFGRFAALRNVSAEFVAGNLYVILGENGAGKSTMLRAIAGLTQPTRGRVTVLGSPNLRDVAHQVGYMAHPSLLYDEMNGLENLEYFSQLYGLQDQKRCETAIEAVGLDPGLRRPVGQYSQGMRQRMSLARAMLNDPKLLLLDEPFSNVDVTSTREMTQLLGRMRDAGKTIFVVTHQAQLLERVADEFIWMHAGQIEKRTQTLSVEVVK